MSFRYYKGHLHGYPCQWSFKNSIFPEINEFFKDCTEEDCFDAPVCSGTDYGAPFEDCSDDKDNDFDGKVDCEDDDCDNDPMCMGELYAAP